jgi:ATP-binding cassette subfamily B protein
MLRKTFRKAFALSETGAANLIKASLACALSNLCLMLPFVLLFLLAAELTGPLGSGGERGFGWISIVLTVLAVVLACAIFLLYRLRYRMAYVTTYAESSRRRIRLAEKLRRLPLSFF